MHPYQLLIIPIFTNCLQRCLWANQQQLPHSRLLSPNHLPQSTATLPSRLRLRRSILQLLTAMPILLSQLPTTTPILLGQLLLITVIRLVVVYLDASSMWEPASWEGRTSLSLECLIQELS
jgi:hypothetical protein